MSYELRGQGFTRATCHLSQKEVDNIRTALALLPRGSEVEWVVDTYKSSNWTEQTSIYLGEKTYLEGRCQLDVEDYIELDDTIIPAKWLFNFTEEIPF